MAFDFSKLFVVGTSSRGLFDLEEENRIFNTDGLTAFIKYQREHEDVVSRQGSAFLLIKGLLGINSLLKNRKVEVVLLSRNHPDVSLRVVHSIDHYKLEITRAALTGGDSLAPYLSALKTSLFLSQSAEDVQLAANQGIAGGLIYSPPPEVQTRPADIRNKGIFSSNKRRRELFAEDGLLWFSEFGKRLKGQQSRRSMAKGKVIVITLDVSAQSRATAR
jgi:5'-nucleotidase